MEAVKIKLFVTTIALHILLASCEEEDATRSAKERQQCTPVDCKWGDWHEWGSCSFPCGNSGTQRRARPLKTMASCGGKWCEGSTSERRACNRVCPNGGIPMKYHCDCEKNPYFGVCCEHGCIRSEWSGWGPCNATCLTKKGTKTRMRVIEDDFECHEKSEDAGECMYDCGKHGSMGADGKCNCHMGHTGECCQEAICGTSPCKWCENGGQVSCSLDGGYICDCPYPYTGDRCQTSSPTKPPPLPACSGKDFTFHITCDDRLTVYLDGGRQSSPWYNNHMKVSSLKVKGCTKVIAVECIDWGGHGYIVGSGTNGLITDRSWRCTETEDAGWEKPGFVETPGIWTAAYDHSGSLSNYNYPPITKKARFIWTKVNKENKRVYCRKTL